MVYMTPGDLGWKPYVTSWLDNYIRHHEYLHEDGIKYLEDQFDAFFELALSKVKPLKDEEPMPTVPV